MKKDKRSLSLLQSLLSLLLFLILSGAEAPRLENPNKKKQRWSGRTLPHISPRHSLHHSPCHSLFNLQISFPYFLQPSSIFMLSPVSSISLSPLSLLLSVGVLSVTAGLRLGHRVPVNVDRSSTCGAAALPMFADLFRMRSDTTRAHTQPRSD